LTTAFRIVQLRQRKRALDKRTPAVLQN